MLIYIGFLVLVTVSLAVLFCRHQVARRKPISALTVFQTALSATLIYSVCAFSPDMFTRLFWNRLWHDENFGLSGFFLIEVGIPFVICLLSATVFVDLYRYWSRTKKNHDA
jgi:hypothetical protein